MLALFLSKLRLLLKSPMIIFIYSIISKWYIMVMLSAIVVVFWVFKGLTEAGVLQAAEKVVSQALVDTKSVARYCIPKITNLDSFWRCLQNPPNYSPTKEEEDLTKKAKDLLDFEKYDKHKDPYAES